MKFERNVPQQGDALDLLVSQSNGRAALVITDYQHRYVMDYLALGNEGAHRKRALRTSADEQRIHRRM